MLLSIIINFKLPVGVARSDFIEFIIIMLMMMITDNYNHHLNLTTATTVLNSCCTLIFLAEMNLIS